MFEDEKDLNEEGTTGTSPNGASQEEKKQPDYTMETDSTEYTIKPDHSQDDVEWKEVNTYQNKSDDSNHDTYYNQSGNADDDTYYNQSNNNDDDTYYNQSGNKQDSYYNNNNSYYDSGNSPYQNNSDDNGNKKKNNVMIGCIVGAAIVAVIGVSLLAPRLFGVIDNKLGTEEKKVETATEKEYPTIGSTGTDDNSKISVNTEGVYITDVSNVVDDVMPSIVAITSTTKVEANNYDNPWFYSFGDQNDQNEAYEETGAGSGIIVKQSDTELLVVTNNHVVEGADSLSVQFVNGVSINGAIKSTDEAADIAIVSIALSDIDEETLAAIKIATLGSSDDTNVGEGVVAIGNALGYGQSVTTGVISAKDRQISVDDKVMTVLQTDAAINGGNSGGALLNSKGEVIGINVAKYSSSSYTGTGSIEGMGFAIPISSATDIISDLMTKQTRSKVDEKKQGYLGIKGVDVNASTAEMYSIPEGIYIKEVIKDGAADKAGLASTDVITKIDGQTIKSMASLKEKLQYYEAGETITITIQRNKSGSYKEKELEITLSASTIIEDETQN